jgi:oxygen-independent coproporphyrinogen-3 oxidase
MGPNSPFHLYVHFPFCSSRCPYCAFYFVVGRGEVRAAYVDAVVEEVRRAASDPRFAGRTVGSVYFGGGTPSLMEAAAVARIRAAAGASFAVEPDAETSLEANPDGLEDARLAALRESGVNRLTLGWQALRPEHLRTLGRTHAPEDARRSLETARRAGFENVGVDLMFGLPRQTAEEWRADLAQVVALGPDHVSAYELTLEEGTRFARRSAEGRLDLPDEETRADMFEAVDEVLQPAGIRRYEISNFARPGRECRHNVAGWRGGDLLGVGASAASHVEHVRWTNVADLDEYVRRIGRGESAAGALEELDEETWAAEDLYLGLRLRDGLDAGERLRRVPEPGRSRLQAVLDGSAARGLLESEGDRVCLSRRGRLLADQVFAELLVRS